jgi:hypothetical protein
MTDEKTEPWRWPPSENKHEAEPDTVEKGEVPPIIKDGPVRSLLAADDPDASHAEPEDRSENA